MKTEVAMRAERLLPQEEKIKYVLKGETRYYTREELKEYKRRLYADNGYPFDDEERLDRRIDRLIEILKENDGDPYGHIPQPIYDHLHNIEANGGVYVIH